MSTRAYVDLMFAWGHARLGDAETARQLVREAAERLHPTPEAANSDPAHAWLLDAFTFRIEEAIAARPHGGPRPAGLARRRDAIDGQNRTNQSSRRYVVDRLRQASRILEPSDEVDPYAPWASYPLYGPAVRRLTAGPHEQWADRVQEFCDRIDREGDILDRLNAYRTLVVSDEIAGSEFGAESADRARRVATETLARRWADHPDVRLLFARHCPPPTEHKDKKAQAEYQADAANPGPRVECQVFGGAAWLHRTILHVASRNGWRDLIAAHADDVVQLLAAPAPGSGHMTETRDLARTLVRLAMREEALRLSNERRDIELAGYRESGADRQLVVSLAVAAIDLWLGRPERANEVLDLACRDLDRLGQPAAKVGVIREYLDTLVHLDWSERRGRLDAMLAALPSVPNGFTTQEWYSRLHLGIADRVVLASALPGFGIPDSSQMTDTDVGARQEALRAARARLLEWGQPDWGPRTTHSDRARPGHANHP